MYWQSKHEYTYVQAELHAGAGQNPGAVDKVASDTGSVCVGTYGDTNGVGCLCS
jgi:hypothetical protein